MNSTIELTPNTIKIKRHGFFHILPLVQELDKKDTVRIVYYPLKVNWILRRLLRIKKLTVEITLKNREKYKFNLDLNDTNLKILNECIGFQD